VATLDQGTQSTFEPRRIRKINFTDGPGNNTTAQVLRLNLKLGSQTSAPFHGVVPEARVAYRLLNTTNEHYTKPDGRRHLSFL
jgi:hypothetical protein